MQKRNYFGFTATHLYSVLENEQSIMAYHIWVEVEALGNADLLDDTRRHGIHLALLLFGTNYTGSTGRRNRNYVFRIWRIENKKSSLDLFLIGHV